MDDLFLSKLNVPHEVIHKLERYAELLGEWNAKFNLVSASTIPALWQRHFLDSAQLMRWIPAGNIRLADIGSGAGFPGLVLAIMGVGDVHLIESIGKKAAFLRAVVDDLKLPNVTAHNERVEKIRDLNADVVTARAVTALPELLSLAKPLMKKDAFCLFLKGQKAPEELKDAAKYWTFAAESFTSLSDPHGAVLKIDNLKIIRAHVRKSR